MGGLELTSSKRFWSTRTVALFPVVAVAAPAWAVGGVGGVCCSGWVVALLPPSFFNSNITCLKYSIGGTCNYTKRKYIAGERPVMYILSSQNHIM